MRKKTYKINPYKEPNYNYMIPKVLHLLHFTGIQYIDKFSIRLSLKEKTTYQLKLNIIVNDINIGFLSLMTPNEINDNKRIPLSNLNNFFIKFNYANLDKLEFPLIGLFKHYIWEIGYDIYAPNYYICFKLNKNDKYRVMLKRDAEHNSTLSHIMNEKNMSIKYVNFSCNNDFCYLFLLLFNLNYNDEYNQIFDEEVDKIDILNGSDLEDKIKLIQTIVF